MEILRLTWKTVVPSSWTHPITTSAPVIPPLGDIPNPTYPSAPRTKIHGIKYF